MPTMIYSPGIKVYVDTENHGTLDLSEDITDGNMVRRSDGVSTFTFSLQNTRRKYDGKFTPNDRIIVLMKRITWVQTFTGYLNSVPLITAWPKVVSVSASCSLKRLQYWYWDPYSAAAYNLTTLALLAPKAGDNSNTDGGLTNLILTVLDQVVGWPKTKVHIGRIPPDWMAIAQKIAREIADEVDAADKVTQAYQDTLGIKAVIGGDSTSVASSGKALPAGTYGGYRLDAEGAENATTIYDVGVSLGVLERDIVTAFSVVGAETGGSFHILGYGDDDSVGLFQQRTGWGGLTDQERMDAVASSTAFFKALLDKGDARLKRTTWEAGQDVQNSAFDGDYPGHTGGDIYGYNYKQYTPMALAMMKKMTQVPTSKGVDPSRSQGVATGSALVTFARQMIQDNPSIDYARAGTMNFDPYPPQSLDCQLLVRYVYYHVMGNNEGKLSSAVNVTTVFSQCEEIDVIDAALTPGAVLVKVGEHIALSIGGYQTIEIGSVENPARIVDYGSADGIKQYYNAGGLLPGITYPNVGTATTAYGGAKTDNQGYAVDTGQGTYTYNDTGLEAPGGKDDFFNSLFGKQGFIPVPVDSAQLGQSASLSGIRALLNDQPLLGGFLKNVVNASLRSFCSAPNGDFIAWFPDYYGLWGTAARMEVETIELLDFEANWSDDFFVTHQFTVLGFMNQIDVATGESSVQFGYAVNFLAYQTYGLANIDVRAILEGLFGIAPTQEEAEKFADFIYRKFGARPDYQVIDGMISNNDRRAEFFSALYLFMRQWAYQYNASVPLTFMPELWPGMLLQIPAFDFQGYITTVTHSFQFGPQGGFSTTVNLAAPARMPKDGASLGANALLGLPLAAGFTPGLTPEQAQKSLHPAIEPEPVIPARRQLPGWDAV